MSDSDRKVSPVETAEFANKEEIAVLEGAQGEPDMNEYLPKWDKPWYKHPHFRFLYFCVFLITLTSTNNGYDGSMLNGLQSLNVWHKDLGNPTGQTLGALSNGNTFGVILSFVIAPYISDHYGRRIGIFLGQGLCIVGAILQGVSTNYAFFLCSRIVLGLGSGIALVGSPTLISEISYPTHRPTATAFYNTCWYVGSIIAAWVTYGTRVIDDSYAWRIPSYLQGIVPVFQLALFWLSPESPRFYVAKGKHEKAREILTKFHVGDSQDPQALRFIDFEIREIERALELEKLASNSSYMDFIRLPSFRKRLFLCFFTACMMQLSGNGLVSYYLNKVLNSIGITGEKEQLEINGCLNIYNMVIAMVAAAFVGRFKRRLIFLFSITGMLTSFVIWTILSAEASKNDYPTSLSNGVLAFIFIFYGFYNIAMNGLPYEYITSILPYSHRAKGINIFQLSQMAVIIYNGYVNPIAMDKIEWKYYIVFCAFLAVEFVVVFFFYPETGNKTLEEVSAMFEGNDVHQTIESTDHIPKSGVEHKELV